MYYYLFPYEYRKGGKVHRHRTGGVKSEIAADPRSLHKWITKKVRGHYEAEKVAVLEVKLSTKKKYEEADLNYRISHILKEDDVPKWMGGDDDDDDDDDDDEIPIPKKASKVKTCSMKIKSGPNKGKICGTVLKDGKKYCGKHSSEEKESEDPDEEDIEELPGIDNPELEEVMDEIEAYEKEPKESGDTIISFDFTTDEHKEPLHARIILMGNEKDVHGILHKYYKKDIEEFFEIVRFGINTAGMGKDAVIDLDSITVAKVKERKKYDFEYSE